MPLFIKQTINPTPQEITAEIAQIVYDTLLSYGHDDLTKIFVKTGIKIKLAKQVYELAKRLEKEFIDYVKANPTCTRAEADSSINTELLDITKLRKNIIDYNPTFDGTRNFARFKTEI